jgi:hypothetical protein
MSESTHNTTGPGPFTRPGFIISAALVIALIAALIVVFFLPKGDGTAQPAPSSPPDSVSAAPTTSADAAGKSVCGLPSTSETALGTAPKSRWELVARMAAPTDPKTFGPGVTDNDRFRSCFAHSPTGALYAAMNVGALGSAGSPQLSVQLADKLLVPGKGRDAAMQEAAGMVASRGSDTSIQVRGFVIKSYTPSEANVDLAFETNKGALVHTVLSMRWMDGDWKVKPADDGVTFSGVAQLSDLSGFILWSGV